MLYRWTDCTRPKTKAEALRRAGSAKAKTAGGGSNEASVLQLHRPNLDGKGDLPKKKKKEKAMYEHVGRMNVRPFQEDVGQDPGQVSVACSVVRGYQVPDIPFLCLCVGAGVSVGAGATF